MINKVLHNILNNNEFIAIVANGEPSNNPNITRLLQQATLIIACDGACAKLNNLSITPDYVIGDNDSITNNYLAKHSYIYDSDQNTNDLTKAFNFLKDKLKLQLPVIIFNANGYREDHFIANFALLNEFGIRHDKLFMLSDYGIFKYVATSQSIKCKIGQQISIFNLSENNKITSAGLKWELNNLSLNKLFAGTLNQAIQTNINITIQKPIIVYITFDFK